MTFDGDFRDAPPAFGVAGLANEHVATPHGLLERNDGLAHRSALARGQRDGVEVGVPVRDADGVAARVVVEVIALLQDHVT